ncbi:putative Peptidase S8/S53 domain-containing protein [Seiridium cardinale]|uniref:tripeptidyl-peptidase II n=1 Tax=Seiridium cardinale TaxID=138064 RepID=A0ABR2Y916_9PEZI
MKLIPIIAALIAVASARSVTVPAGVDGQHSPAGWRRERRAEPAEKIELSIELRQPGLAELKSRLAAISDPNNVDYGKHLTKDEVDAYQQPDAHALRAVTSWLKDSGIISTRIEGPSVKFRSSVDTVRNLVGADIGHYSYKRSSTHLRAPSYTIPDHLAGHIRFIHPLVHFAKPVRSHVENVHKRGISLRTTALRNNVVRRDARYKPYGIASRRDQSNSTGPCADGVTPECLRKLYSLPTSNNTGYPTGRSKTRFGVAGFLDEYIHYDDVSAFMQKYAPAVHATGYNFTVSLLNNATNPQSPADAAGAEASLDMEYALSLGYPTDITYYSMSGRGEKIENGTLLPTDESNNEPFLQFLQYMISLSDDEVPHVLSISYADDEDSIPIDYATKVCDLFAQLSARGTTIFSASGDGGASGSGLGECYSNDGQERKTFVPTFPPSCPYVTAVGATGYSLPLEGALLSGGGFSNIFPTPDWQKSAADEYIKTMNGAHMGFYNATGRAIPDISAPGESFPIITGGEETSVRGTSASTPVIAAIVALVNDERLKAGKPSLGWLNPLLYTDRVRKSLVDVSVGSNTPCVYGKNDTEPGFSAYKGYDCVTGLGSVGEFQENIDDHPAHYMANEMAFSHNGMIRGLNAIYLQANHITTTDAPDFLFFVAAWSDWVLDHHSLRETNMFTGFEAIVGISPAEYDGKKVCELIDGFVHHFRQHLADEIETLWTLDCCDEAEARKQDKPGVPPMVLGLCDKTFQGVMTSRACLSAHLV